MKCVYGQRSSLSLLDGMPSQSPQMSDDVECVCRTDQDMHGKVEIAAAAVPE